MDLHTWLAQDGNARVRAISFMPVKALLLAVTTPVHCALTAGFAVASVVGQWAVGSRRGHERQMRQLYVVQNSLVYPFSTRKITRATLS